jgi:hypothetical protein
MKTEYLISFEMSEIGSHFFSNKHEISLMQVLIQFSN